MSARASSRQNSAQRFGTPSANTGLMHFSKNNSSFDHLVGARRERWRHVEAERLGGLEVDYELEFRGLINRQLCWFLTIENAPDVEPGSAISICNVVAIAHQPTLSTEFAVKVHGRDRVSRCEGDNLLK